MTRGDTTDLAAAAFAEYVAHGWRLCAIPRGTKGPRTLGWNTAEKAIADPGAAAHLPGAGLLHALSGTAALDLDDLAGAAEWLAVHGIDLGDLLEDEDAVQIRSGRPNRGKLLYALPDGVAPLRTLKVAPDGRVLFELRCASADGESVQDVLPPSQHPETGQPYTWAGAGDWRRLPPLPAPLLALWRSLAAKPAAVPAAAPGEDPPAVARLLAAVNQIDPDASYDTWREVGMALKDQVGERGFTAWDAWSARGTKYPGAAALRKKWESFQGRGITAASIYALASRSRPPQPPGAAEQTLDAEPTAASPWPEVRPVAADLPPAPTFDGGELLPQMLRDFVLDEADRMPCPPDYVAATLMAAMGAVIGARCALKPKKRDDWIVTPNLWGALIGDPSTKKSPALSTVMRFIERLEAAEAKTLPARERAFSAERAAYEARQAYLQSQMKKAASGKPVAKPKQKGQAELIDGADGGVEGDPMRSAMAELELLEEPQKPEQRRYRCNDSTVPKIGDLHAHNDHGLLIYRDELVGLLASWEREGNESDAAFYLEGFNGTGSYTIDRVARGSQFIPNLCLSLFGGMQPDLLERYLAQVVGSMGNDGRFARFQMLVYPEPTPWAWRDRYPVRAPREFVRDMFDRLAAFDPVQDGATAASDFVKLPYFTFDDAAQELFITWSHALWARIDAEAAPLMKQHLAKFERLFCCLCLILHCAGGQVAHHVDVTTAERAVAWCSYLEAHARRVYALVESARVTTAKMIGRRLIEKKLPEGFTARDVVKKGWQGITTSMQAEQALAVLEEHGWIVGEDGEGVGRPTTRWYANPGIWTAAATTKTGATPEAKG